MQTGAAELGCPVRRPGLLRFVQWSGRWLRHHVRLQPVARPVRLR